MKKFRGIHALLLIVLTVFLLVHFNAFDGIRQRLEGDTEFRSTLNVSKSMDDSAATSPPTAAPQEENSPEILPTTISGGMIIKNSTPYSVDVSELMSMGCPISLTAEQPQILIIHTHSSEAYTPAGLDDYVASGTSRTLDPEYSVIRVGDELEEIFESYGLNVIHDRQIYDYPSYTGSYTRSGESVESYLSQYPTIKIVIDLHRDALGTDDTIFKVVADETGSCASQIMILVGSDASGLEHPQWQQNLRLALYIQNAVTEVHPTLMRPVQLVSSRYNQQLCQGSMILEVGSSGNTLQEALAAIRLFGRTAGPALAELIE